MSTPRILIWVAAAVVFIIVPVGTAISYWITGTDSEQEQPKQVSPEQAEQQKQEAMELCRQCKEYMRQEYAEKNDANAVIEQVNNMLSDGYYKGDYYQVTSVSPLRSGKSPNLMNVSITCYATEAAADRHSHLVYSFNWKSGNTQTSWN
jgi:hypothetical protein